MYFCIDDYNCIAKKDAFMDDNKLGKCDIVNKMPWGHYILYTLSETCQVKEIYLANKHDCFSL